jgi:hypothetical protein
MGALRSNSRKHLREYQASFGAEWGSGPMAVLVTLDGLRWLDILEMTISTRIRNGLTLLSGMSVLPNQRHGRGNEKNNDDRQNDPNH